MQSPSSCGAPAAALLAPIQALLRGFDFTPLGEAEAAEAPGATAQPRRERTGVEGPQARQGFCVGSLNLMIRYEDGSELTDLPQVHRLPNAPHWVLGMANLHGMLVPVFDLARYFGIERTAKVKPMLLVLAHGADAAGMAIDGLPKRLRFGEEHLADQALVPEMLEGVIRRAALIDGELWFDLDSTTLLARLEQSFGALRRT